jgi:hypothetical protein
MAKIIDCSKMDTYDMESAIMSIIFPRRHRRPIKKVSAKRRTTGHNRAIKSK